MIQTITKLRISSDALSETGAQILCNILQNNTVGYFLLLSILIHGVILI